jgi:nucleotide-binding universal stress UspA family protein
MHFNTNQFSPAQAAVEYCRNTPVDIIILGTRGEGPVKRFFLGSFSRDVLNDAPCAVAIVKHFNHRRVLQDK